LSELAELLAGSPVEFATMRPPGSPFAVLERRVVVTAPEPLRELSRAGDVETLDELVACLRDRDTAWPAEVLLAAMTGAEAKEVETFGADPAGWWATFGEGAHDHWAQWLDENRERLRWDPEAAIFTVDG
jgi:hypothetical protein